VRPGGTDLRAGSNATRQHARILAPSKRWSISLVSGVSATVTCVRFARKLPLLQPFRTSGCRKRPDSVPNLACRSRIGVTNLFHRCHTFITRCVGQGACMDIRIRSPQLCISIALCIRRFGQKSAWLSQPKGLDLLGSRYHARSSSWPDGLTFF
jgi:hypothetical protein